MDRKERGNMEITKKTTMGEMLEYDMGIAYILMQCGMHCVGCPSSIGESLEAVSYTHLDVYKRQVRRRSGQ